MKAVHFILFVHRLGKGRIRVALAVSMGLAAPRRDRNEDPYCFESFRTREL